jgi:hypothetical protein
MPLLLESPPSICIFFSRIRYAILNLPMKMTLGLSATSQQYFSFRTNQSPATSQQYFSLITNQHQPLQSWGMHVYCYVMLYGRLSVSILTMYQITNASKERWGRRLVGPLSVTWFGHGRVNLYVAILCGRAHGRSTEPFMLTELVSWLLGVLYTVALELEFDINNLY